MLADVEREEEEQGGGEEVMMKNVRLALSGFPHSSVGSRRLEWPRGQAQLRGEKEQVLPRSFWIDQRCGRQQVWWCDSLQGWEVMKMWKEEKLKQRRDERALPSSFTGSRVISGYLDPMLELGGELQV